MRRLEQGGVVSLHHTRRIWFGLCCAFIFFLLIINVQSSGYLHSLRGPNLAPGEG